MIHTAKKLDAIQPFVVMEVLARANELRAQGHPVIDMEVGEPDFETPAPIVKAAKLALENGATKYTAATGLPALREAISGYYQSDYGISVAPERIVVTAGGSGALLLATALLTDPGDGWMMTDPGYPCNRNFVRTFGGEPQLVPVGAHDNYQLSADLVRDHWQESTRVLLLASPANPTGTEVSPDELNRIAQVVKKGGGVLVVDEIYHGLSFDSDEKTSALSVSDDVIVINSFSKYFGMTGWRLGWMVVPEAVVALVEKLAQNLFICPSSLAQHAALAAFTPDARRIMEANRAEFRARRDFLVPALEQAGFTVSARPSGAFYIYAEIPEPWRSGSQKGAAGARELCRYLLNEHHVGVTPGQDFGEHRAGEFVRFSYAQALPRLSEAMDRIQAALTVTP